MRALPTLVVASLLFLSPQDLAAEARPLAESPITIDADELVFEEARDLYEAAGNVVVRHAEGRTLSADWITFSSQTRIGVAVGQVVLRDGDGIVRADFATVDFDSLTAMATRATLDSPSPGFVISGETIQRTGPNTYRVENGVFTACRCSPNESQRPWEITAREADVEVGGYAVGRGVTLKVLGLPVLYTPRMILPVKAQRQTGFLIPSVSASGRNGTTIETPLFVTLGESLNLLLRPSWLSKRGFKNRVETEYVFGSNSYGMGGFSMLANDDEVHGDQVNRPYSDDRWAYWLRHEQPLGRGMRFGADVNAVSDNDYVVDFDDLGREKRSARLVESSAWATFARGPVYAGVEGSLIDDLQSPNDLDRDDFLLNRLPDVRLSLIPQPLGPLAAFAGLDVRYTYFYQREDPATLRGNLPVALQFFDTGRDGVFDADEPRADGARPGTDVHADNAALGGPEGDGLFQEGELLADSGHRVDLYPKVAVPLRFGPIETVSEVGFRETLYFADRADSSHRELWTGRIDTRMRLVRDLSVGSTSLRHVLEPKLGFTAVAAKNQTRNPLFIPQGEIDLRRLADLDPRVLTRNPSDRVRDARILNGSISNQFYGARSPGSARPRRVAQFRIGSGYDFLRGRMTDVFANGVLEIHENLSFGAVLGYDPKETRVSEARADASWRSEPRFVLRTGDNERRDSLGLSYRFLRDQNTFFENFNRDDEVFEEFDEDLTRIDQLAFSGKFAAMRQLDLFGQGYLSLGHGSGGGGSVGLTLLSDCACWDFTAALEQRTRPADTRFTFKLRLAGLGFLP